MTLNELQYLLFSCCLILAGLLTAAMISHHVLRAEVDYLNNHITYLEEYIEDNGLPTPAMRIEQ